MSKGNNPGLTILHIRRTYYDCPPAAVTTNSIETLLQSTSLNVEHCSDVYRGLARIGRADSPTPDVVIVSIDGLSSTELEFFSIVSRLHRQISVYVYSRRSSRARIDRAIELGAAGMASVELIQSIIESEAEITTGIGHHSDARGTPTLSPPQQLIAGETPAVNNESVASEPEPYPEESLSHSTQETETVPFEDEKPYDLDDIEPDEKPVGPARVPWIDYNDEPLRQAPLQQKPHDPHKVVKQRAQTENHIDEPLLTEEELQALIGDDISAIVPDEREALISDDSINEESTS